MSKKIFALIISAVFALAAPLHAFAAPVPARSEQYVNDYADIIDYEYEYKISSEAASLCENNSGLQIVILTVGSLSDEKIGDYAKKVYSSWNIGNSGIGNGLLLVFSKEDRNYWAVTGEGISEYFTVSQLKNLLDETIEAGIENENLSETFYAFFTAASEKMTAATARATENGAKTESRPNTAIVILIIAAALALFFILSVLAVRFINIRVNRRKRKYRKPGSGTRRVTRTGSRR